MTNNRMFRTLLFIVVAFTAKSADCDEPTKPNILFILADDLGKEWVSCYGSTSIETPHIDRLAATGMKFENFYSMPQCTPTRATLLTGQYPFRTGWINHWDVPRWGVGCHFDPNHYYTFARILKSVGYKTCIAGKWQINDFRVQPNVLSEHGFDEFCMWTGYEGMNPPSAERYWDPYIFTKNGSRTESGRFGEDVFCDFIVDFLKQDTESPKCIYYPMCLPHGPLTTTPAEPNVTGRDRFSAMVRYVDSTLGRLVEELEKANLRESTIIFWTTDNGTSRGIVGDLNGHKVKGAKGQTNEPGVCQPMIVNCPGIVPQGTTTKALADLTDILPTFSELAGAEVPKDLEIDGKSFAKLILGKSDDSQRDWIMAMGGQPGTIGENGRVRPVFDYRDRVIRDKVFKLYVGTDRTAQKLFNLLNDPFEKTNLISSNQPDVTSAKERLMKVVNNFPKIDAHPKYDATPAQPWDKKGN